MNRNHKLKPTGLVKTSAKIKELKKQLRTASSKSKSHLTTALQVQQNYVRSVTAAVNLRARIVENQVGLAIPTWATTLTGLKIMAGRGNWQKELSPANQELTFSHLFALLDRKQLLKQALRELGLVGKLCQPQQLKKLLTFSDGGWYDAVLGVGERLTSLALINQATIEKEIVRQLGQFVLYELKELITKQAKELGWEIDC